MTVYISFVIKKYFVCSFDVFHGFFCYVSRTLSHSLSFKISLLFLWVPSCPRSIFFTTQTCLKIKTLSWVHEEVCFDFHMTHISDIFLALSLSLVPACHINPLVFTYTTCSVHASVCVYPCLVQDCPLSCHIHGAHSFVSFQVQAQQLSLYAFIPKPYHTTLALYPDVL